MMSILEFVPYLAVFSMIISVFAIVISIFNLAKWVNIEPETTKARVFLDRKFLNTNFKLTFLIIIISGVLISIHSTMEYFQIVGVEFSGFYIIYYGLLPAVTVCLLLLAFYWFKLLNMKFR
jgi:hypothetical protein